MNFQLRASKKENNLKIAEEQIAQVIYLHQQLLCLVVWTRHNKISSVFLKCKFYLFEKDISCGIFILMQYTQMTSKLVPKTIYLNNNQANRQDVIFIIHICGCVALVRTRCCKLKK